MSARILPAAARRPEPWRNGGGVTFEVARAAHPHPHPHRPADFLWRVSIADVTRPGPFSRFSGYQRLIAVIAGAGMRLRWRDASEAPGPADRADITVLAPFSVLRFDGDAVVAGELPHGAVEDFNVIFDPSACHATLTFHDGPGEVALTQGEAIAVNVSERSTPWSSAASRGELAPFDGLQLSGQSLKWLAPVRLALVRIDALPS